MKKRYRWNYKKCLKNLLVGFGYIALGGGLGFAIMLSIFAPVMN